MTGKVLSVVGVGVLMTALALAALAGGCRKAGGRAPAIEESLRPDVPRVLCVRDDVVTGGQPADAAFAKLADAGFRAVLDMRTEAEGHDAARERSVVEAAGLRYISIPVASAEPGAGRVEEFIRAVKDEGNRPLFVHCASGNRVGAFWLIYRVLEDGFAEEEALAEAEAVGLRSPELKRFALDYLAARRKAN